MSYIPTLLASLDTRLDELATEISTLTDARAALRTQTRTSAPAPTAGKGAPRTRPPRPARQIRKPAPNAAPPAPDPTPELAATDATGSTSEPSTARRRASAATTPRKRSVSSLSVEQLERLLADARSGLSAGAIAEQAGVGYRGVLAHLRALEASGKVRRTGSRRSTLWRVITDEDRIAERTAELERLAATRRDGRTQRRPRARPS